MEIRDLPFSVYSNVDKFFASRNITRETPSTNKDEFSINMRSMGYVLIEGTAAARERLPQRNVVFVIFSQTSEAARKKSNFKKLLDQIISGSGKSSATKKNYPNNTDMIFISNERPVSAISGYDEIISEMKKESTGVYTEAYTYEKIIITPDNNIVPQHRIMSQEEVEKLNENRLTSDARRPPIPYSDLPIVWLGARPGDVIEIRKVSGSTGYSINYRVVK
jgi:DNA-directed RNA polymerase subunit H